MVFRIYILLITIGVGCLWMGCVAHHLDEPSRQQGRANNNLPAVPPLAGKLTADPQEQSLHAEDTPPSDATDQLAIQHGKSLFHGKAACAECHGLNGNLTHVSPKLLTQLEPRPTNLRMPTDRSIRQLYLILKYGVPGTRMTPSHGPMTLSKADILDLMGYLSELQGRAWSREVIASQSVQPDTETDAAISKMCEHEDISNFDKKEHCEDRYAKRYLNLLIGRPPDISPDRYGEIKKSCAGRAAKDLDTLELCYRAEYTATRAPGLSTGDNR